MRSWAFVVSGLAVALVGSGLSVAQAFTHAVPTSLRSTDQGATHLELDWNDVPGAPAYVVHVSDDPAMEDPTEVVFDDSEGTIEDLDADTTYWFRVAVVDPSTGDALSDLTEPDFPSAATLPTSSASGGEAPAGPRPTGQTLS